MERCHSVEMRKNLKAVELLKKHGFDFVVIPVIDAGNKKELLHQANMAFDKLIEKAGD